MGSYLVHVWWIFQLHLQFLAEMLWFTFSCVTLEVSGCVQGYFVGCCDFKKSGCRSYHEFCVCLLTRCHACSVELLLSSAVKSQWHQILALVLRGKDVTIRWQVWFIRAENKWSIFLVVFTCEIMFSLSLSHHCKFFFPVSPNAIHLDWNWVCSQQTCASLWLIGSQKQDHL